MASANIGYIGQTKKDVLATCTILTQTEMTFAVTEKGEKTMESEVVVCPHCGAAIKMSTNRNLQCVCEYCKSVLREGMTPEAWDIFVLTMKERYLRAPAEELECLEKGMKRWLGILLCLLAPVLLTVFASLFMG